MRLIKEILYIIALICAGGLFGFFFTMNFSILKGLDLADPAIALAANQEIGHATQSSLFAAILLGLPLSIVTIFLVQLSLRDPRGRLALFIALLGFIGIMITTLMFSAPLNQSLEILNLSNLEGDPAAIWQEYSTNWQRWNWLRIICSSISLIAMGFAFRAQGQYL